MTSSPCPPVLCRSTEAPPASQVYLTLYLSAPQRHPAWLPGPLQERFAALAIRQRIWGAREQLWNYLVRVSLPIALARELSTPLLGRVYTRLWEMEEAGKV